MVPASSILGRSAFAQSEKCTIGLPENLQIFAPFLLRLNLFHAAELEDDELATSVNGGGGGGGSIRVVAMV